MIYKTMESISRILQTVLNRPAPLIDGAYSGYYYAYYGEGGFSNDQSFNPILLNGKTPINDPSYNYAFHGSGGYSNDQSFNPILLNGQNGGMNAGSFQLYDVTYALQVKFDVRTINKKLGLLKDASNHLILDTSYSIRSNSFPIDTISVNANEFIASMSAPQVISVGAYQTLYTDYLMAVNKYFFNYDSSNSSLFSDSSILDISNGIFDADQFINLINQKYNPNQNQNYAVPLTGFVTLSNINQLLRYSVYSNVFGNRIQLSNDPSLNKTYNIKFTNGTVTDVSNNLVTTTVFDPITNIATITIQDNNNQSVTVITDDIGNGTSNITTTDSSGNTEFSNGPFKSHVLPTYADVSFSQVPGNYGVSDGFMAGDLIFIPAGLSVLVETVIDPQLDTSSSSIYDLIINSGLAYEYAIDVDKIYKQPTTIISKILSAPILIELANLS